MVGIKERHCSRFHEWMYIYSWKLIKPTGARFKNSTFYGLSCVVHADLACSFAHKNFLGATMAGEQKKWGKGDDAKLAELFQKGPRTGGVSSTDLNAKTIHKVITGHFPTREYKNFAPLFRSKARAWNIDQALTGQRSKFLYSFAMPCHIIISSH
jgi:hypothetical protein